MKQGVLVVDDDPFIRKLVVATLEDVSGFDLYEAADGIEALEVAERRRPAIVFLDVDMPRLDGIEACKRMRAQDPQHDATIVILTASAENEARAAHAGADLFLTKPFSPLDLLRLVDRIGTERSRSPAS